ncbi:MAG: Crp/Fnr family transcriptional regulator [Nostocaceae cyanobacterium]|nr:Crp/Fnr family transcriptional regulator [Nostocaceae cyanobacterium]
MEIETFRKLFPLMSTANQKTLEWLLSMVTEHEYPAGRTVLMEDAWGNAVYFIVAGWVKVRRSVGDDSFTLAILGLGDFFGEMAILDESPRSTDIIALSPVKLLSLSRDKFIDILFQDPQLHHRMLQLMVRRLRQTNLRFELRSSAPGVKLANTLVSLSENYGQKSATAIEIFNVPVKDLADVTEIGVEETTKIMDKLDEKGWIKIDTAKQRIYLLNFKQLLHLAGRV